MIDLSSMNQLYHDMFSTTRFRNLLILVFGMFMFMSCEEEADLSRTFVMQQGEHYASPRLVQSMQSNILNFTAKFNQSAVYHFEETAFQDSKNKLLGFSDCNSLHHENSARFAWQWYNEQLEIYAYCYVNGVRQEKYIGAVALDEENKYQLKITADSYVFQLNHQEPVSIPRGTTCDKGLYYMLWPYFGGTLPAPHDVSISIKIDY
ncbi:hypothetical protein [Chryseolinea sp. H1M3-3]|uniref:hypothetical protein n=1 Tax=Chryseolinea sp. H1M3-3 TaxID=3034144 RepID=UPI0023EB4D4B|nr:hypothetical protein [Chryseolinea sp. H1M3-3]